MYCKLENKNEEIVKSVEDFYRSTIYIECGKEDNRCKKDCVNFSAKPKMPYIGREYGNNSKIPKLVFLSLDSGKSIDDYFTVKDIREKEENNPPQTYKKDHHKHWYQTFDLARIILEPFIDDALKINNQFANPYFIHTNSAKCNEGKKGNAKASPKLFKNCKEYVHKELKILEADIVITQGNEALAIMNVYSALKPPTSIEFDIKGEMVSRQIWTRGMNDKNVIHIHFYHPRNGSFKNQKTVLIKNIETLVFILKEINNNSSVSSENNLL